jgi:hypothetical protein
MGESENKRAALHYTWQCPVDGSKTQENEEKK